IRDKTAAVNANRPARRMGEEPNGVSAGRAIQNGMRIITYSRQIVIRMCSRYWLMLALTQALVKNTLTAADMTSAWAAGMTRTAVSARHHQRAAQEVFGSA